MLLVKLSASSHDKRLTFSCIIQLNHLVEQHIKIMCRKFSCTSIVYQCLCFVMLLYGVLLATPREARELLISCCLPGCHPAANGKRDWQTHRASKGLGERRASILRVCYMVRCVLPKLSPLLGRDQPKSFGSILKRRRELDSISINFLHLLS